MLTKPTPAPASLAVVTPRPQRGLLAHALEYRFPRSRRTLSVPEFKADIGDWVCVTGPSGTGKSTLLRLIAGVVAPSAGHIELAVDSIDALLQPEHRLIGYVDQDASLFDDTLRNNLRAGNGVIGDEELHRVLESLGLGTWAKGLPRGLDTRLSEEGAIPSLGQRMRIAIARTLLLKPRLIVLDEPTASLDDTATQLVIRELRRLRTQAAVVLATHSQALRALAQRHYEVCYDEHLQRSLVRSAERAVRGIRATAAHQHA